MTTTPSDASWPNWPTPGEAGHAAAVQEQQRAAIEAEYRAALAAQASFVEAARAAIVSGRMRGRELLEWLLERPAELREVLLDELLGTAEAPVDGPLGCNLVPYVPSGLAAIVRACLRTPLLPSDVLIDLGAGLGRVCLLAHLLTGAEAVGVELQAPLVARARDAACALRLEAVQFVEADAREASLSRGTVFFMYLPFTGAVLDAVMARLKEVARQKPIVICALGLDLRGHADWLVPRDDDAFWLTLYDSRLPGVATRPTLEPSPEWSLAAELAREI